MDRSKARGMRLPVGAFTAAAQVKQKQGVFRERVERQTADFRAAIDFYRIDISAEARNAPEVSQEFPRPVSSR